MAHRFDDIFDNLKAAGELMVQAGQLQAQALEKLVTVADAALDTHEEHEEVRETVRRLESLVMDLVREVRELKNRNGNP